MPHKAAAAELLKALSLDTRLQIIELLKLREPLCVTEIAQELGVTNSAVSQHLKILRHVGLVKNMRKGFYIPYFLDHESLQCCRQVVNEICACGCHEAAVINSTKHHNQDLKSLKNYEKKLSRELVVVRKRIEEMEINEN